jgi:diguanylate cyclase (GGDEF)-like protein
MTDIKYASDVQEVISAGRTLNVLVVDDSKVVRIAIKEILELGNLQVTEARDANEALEAIYKNLPDLILLDVVMPGTDGITLLKKLRKSYSKLQLPVVMVTSRGSSNEIVQGLDFGANDYVTKPIDFDVLWARISNQLMQKQAAEYLQSAQDSLEKQIKMRTSELNDSNQQLKNEIEARMRTESKLQKQANFDALTHLPNRSLATDRLNQVIAKARRYKLKPCLAFLDLDNFKYINDTFGHDAGDELLREAAQRLSGCARESDTVARLGGDEFLLILDDNKVEDVQHEIDIRHIGDRIIKAFSKPFLIKGQDLNITPSLGFAVYPKDGDDSKKLMRHADVAMYRSKHDGKNTYRFYSPEMTVKAKMRITIESELRHALDRDELSIQYQPIADLKSTKIVKAEALLRWNCKNLGNITPDCFIPIAEDTGLMVPIGSWLIKSVCKQIKLWRDSGLSDICVCINISSHQLQSEADLVNTIKSYIKQYDLTPEAIQLELSEDILVNASSSVRKSMACLKKVGIKILLDNFGKKHASISCLRNYSFDSIKIDRRYIDNIVTSDYDTKLVKAVIAMAKSMGMSVISEGVDNREQLEVLLNEGCDFIQGSSISKPVTVEEFGLLLKNTNEITSSRFQPAELVTGAA